MKAFLKRLPGSALFRGGWPDEARVQIQTPVIRRLLDGNEPTGACLNAGCGEGSFAAFLDSFPKLTQIVHMDLETSNLGRFESDPRHQSIKGSLTELPFHDQEFDFVFCTEVLEHIADDHRAFREIGRVLKPGGIAIISTPTPPAPFDPAHVREGYRLNELRERLAAAGMELQKQDYCMRSLMRMLLKVWRWQFEKTNNRKSLIPRAIILAVAGLDRILPVGKPFDIVVLARKI